ncbi:hypothetical protein VPHF99_0115 [Vibrio phage F99]
MIMIGHQPRRVNKYEKDHSMHDYAECGDSNFL